MMKAEAMVNSVSDSDSDVLIIDMPEVEKKVETIEIPERNDFKK